MTATTDAPKGWNLLHSELPKKALKAISKDVYGVDGLTDVNEGYLITRLFASELPWSWEILGQQYLGCEDRQARGKDYTTRWYLASVHGRLTVAGQVFDGSGAHDNRKIDAAFKGAATVAFKNAAKTAGLFMQLLMDGRAIDFIYQTRDGEVAQGQDAPATEEKPADPPAAPAAAEEPTPAAPAPASTTPTDGGSDSPTAAPAESTAGGDADPIVEAGGIKLRKKQLEAIKSMLHDLKPDDDGRGRAWKAMKAAAAAGQDAYTAGINELHELHTVRCGNPECDHWKVLIGLGLVRAGQAA